MPSRNTQTDLLQRFMASGCRARAVSWLDGERALPAHQRNASERAGTFERGHRTAAQRFSADVLQSTIDDVESLSVSPVPLDFLNLTPIHSCSVSFRAKAVAARAAHSLSRLFAPEAQAQNP
jgi:hypothetical protein